MILITITDYVDLFRMYMLAFIVESFCDLEEVSLPKIFGWLIIFGRKQISNKSDYETRKIGLVSYEVHM